MIGDPCSRAVLPPSTSSPFAAMTLIRNFDATQTQTVVIATDIEVSFGVLCPLVYSLVSPPSFASVSGNTIILTESQTLSSDVGTHTISVLVTSQNYPNNVVPITYSFQANIQDCTVSLFTLSIADQVFTLNSGPTPFPFAPAIM
jgi:hypothetical protein